MIMLAGVDLNVDDVYYYGIHQWYTDNNEILS